MILWNIKADCEMSQNFAIVLKLFLSVKKKNILKICFFPLGYPVS